MARLTSPVLYQDPIVLTVCMIGVRSLIAIGNYRALLFAWSHAFSPWTKIMVE